MSTPKRHHYLPEMYLKRFARCERLWVLDRELGTYRDQSVKDTAVERERYTVEMEDETKNRDIEQFFQVLEGGSSPIIEKLVAREQLEQSERELLSWFIAFFRTRVPEFEASHDAMVDYIMRTQLKLTMSSPQAVRDALRLVKPDWEETPGEADELVRFAQSDEYSIRMNSRAGYLDAMMNAGRTIASLIVAMDWFLVHAPQGKAFVTSDDPLVLVGPSEGRGPLRGVGFATPGALKHIPLAASTLLVIGEQGDRLQHIDATREQVRSTNLLLAASSYRFVVARDEALLRSVAKATGVDARPPAAKVKISGPYPQGSPRPSME